MKIKPHNFSDFHHFFSKVKQVLTSSQFDKLKFYFIILTYNIDIKYIIYYLKKFMIL
jgi:hypothetical protein